MKRIATIFLSATLFSSTVLAADNKIVATYTGGNVTAEQVMEDASRDLWLDSSEALSYGIIDEIVKTKKKGN